MPARARARAKLQAWATAAPASSEEPTDESRAKLTRMLAGREPIEGTPGADYLAGRGIDLEAAHDVRFHASWYGKGPAVVFAIRDKNGDVVAAQGRFLAGNVDPKAQTCGPTRLGVYQTPGALNRHVLVVTEAPIDALSLWACGVPAVALIGTNAPEWLARAGAFRPVFLALDADEAGDRAADKLRPTFEVLGATVTRLRPPIGKDWNDVLRAYNQDGMTAKLQAVIGSELLEAARGAGTSVDFREGFNGSGSPVAPLTLHLKSTGKSSLDDTPPADLPPPPWALDPAWNGLEARRLWWRIARQLARRLEADERTRPALEAFEARAGGLVDARDLDGLWRLVRELEGAGTPRDLEGLRNAATFETGREIKTDDPWRQPTIEKCREINRD